MLSCTFVTTPKDPPRVAFSAAAARHVMIRNCISKGNPEPDYSMPSARSVPAQCGGDDVAVTVSVLLQEAASFPALMAGRINTEQTRVQHEV